MTTNFINIISDVKNLIRSQLQVFFSQTVNEQFSLDDLQILQLNGLNIEEKLIFFITLAPHLQPGFYDSIIKDFLPGGGDFPEFGGVRGANHRGFLPTGETAQFILAGNDIKKRLEVQQLLTEGRLVRENIISLESLKEGEPIMSGRLILSQEWFDKLLFGKETTYKFSVDFPARYISTQMDWNDLVLHPYTFNQINDIRIWLQYHERLNEDKNLSKKIKPGYRILFYGPSGTGKTLTATLLGKEFNKEVYRIDLSQVVSKYIGETEKNLEKVFNRAENKDWILFFDEADALFGKRTNMQSAHDKYANQEVAYLLQRVEEFRGLLILASNFKSNMDDAFTRRFHSVIHFPMPNEMERIKLWKKSLPSLLKADPVIDWFTLASQYELTGAGILNVIHYATLKSLSRSDEYIRKEDLVEGIVKEFRKEEKSI